MAMGVHLRTESAGFSMPETFKCNICEQTFSEKSEFMKHRKNKHPEMVKVFKNNQCIYENECWCRHSYEDTQMNNIKTNENEKLIENCRFS